MDLPWIRASVHERPIKELNLEPPTHHLLLKRQWREATFREEVVKDKSQLPPCCLNSVPVLSSITVRPHSFFFFFFYIYLFLFLAVLGLRFCARAFSSCGERGPLLTAVRRPLTIAASLAAEHRLQTRRLSSCGSRGPAAPQHVGSSQTRARTRVPCIGRQILNHCATREAPRPHSWTTAE